MAPRAPTPAASHFACLVGFIVVIAVARAFGRSVGATTTVAGQVCLEEPRQRRRVARSAASARLATTASAPSEAEATCRRRCTSGCGPGTECVSDVGDYDRAYCVPVER